MGSKDSGTALGWRLLWGVVGGGLTFVVLSVSGLELALPVMVAIVAAAALAVAVVGPALLELLSVV